MVQKFRCRSSLMPCASGVNSPARLFVCLLVLLFATQTEIAARVDPAAQVPPKEVCNRVQIFYYDWYGAPPLQSSFVHWQQGGHTPPQDIGSNFYPLLGPYSSTDPNVLKQHMAWIRQAHIGVLTLTWWGKNSYEDRDTKAVLDAAAEAGLKVDFHIEPYRGRTPKTVANDIAYILRTYGHHPAFYRAKFLGGKPMFYIFEALRNSAREWRPITDRLHAGSDPVILIAQTSNVEFVRDGGFDGGYTYDGLAPFKIPGFLRRWKDIARNFAAAGKLFIPSVGPGYWDDRAVPVHGAEEPEAARTRDNGFATTYDDAWKAAIQAGPPVITVTSFNEWHEGSQIEPAVEHRADGYRYPPYRGGSLEYLTRTAVHVHQYEGKLKSASRSKSRLHTDGSLVEGFTKAGG